MVVVLRDEGVVIITGYRTPVLNKFEDLHILFLFHIVNAYSFKILWLRSIILESLLTK